ncbi:riboflavin synthase [Sphingomonas sp.]|uniref:riboflavin synthase n=1 Tax=Sphingomonas sp. TaxID=28214 RepID=UPI002DD677C0|nr:riboflavin synthase [Sphingomonas sp.]
MFTGIVSDVGTIVSVEDRGDLRVRVDTAYDTGTVDLGASIACSGVCLTVVGTGPGWFDVDVSAETTGRTARGMWTVGRRLNLERALKLGDELGGHIVTGHVDGLGFVSRGDIEGGSLRFSIKAPERLAPYIAEKGSITINGVSLTVNEVEDRDDGTYFGVNIIPHTAEVTAMFDRGDTVNIEIDVLARYLQRMESYRAKAG